MDTPTDMPAEFMTVEERFERDRVAALRTFEVEHTNGVWIAGIVAHFHQIDEAGALCFYTVEATGRQVIRTAFSARGWCRLRETTDPETTANINANWFEAIKHQEARTRRKAVSDEELTKPKTRTTTSSKKFLIH